MKKFLLKNINTDIAQIVSLFWLISILAVGMLALEAFKVQVIAFCETHNFVVVLLVFFAYAAIGGYPWMRIYPSHHHKKETNETKKGVVVIEFIQYICLIFVIGCILIPNLIWG